ncbi:MAG: LysM domain-containing protein [Syntrophaceae bacterium]
MKRTCRKNVFLYMMMGLLIVFVWSCASSQKKASETEKTDSSQQGETTWPPTSSEGTAAPSKDKDGKTYVTYYVHTVKWQGESLSIIAGWYTGDVQNWKILAEANPSMDPTVVVVGQKINIPEHIMTKRSPMTKAHVDSYYHKHRKTKTRSSPSGTKEEAPSLYGPK